MQDGKDWSPSAKPCPDIQLLGHKHDLSEDERIYDGEPQRFEAYLMSRQNNRLVKSEKGEEEPKIQEHGKQFGKVVQDSLLERTLGLLLLVPLR